ncbi:uncharacterized protein CELE_ZK1290.10 [Caenorhabditis elegans]|uniref:Uncharacterized protein ZK1290.10 n=1 Tax=Caenorhabditis elegans TaxID=6239 RepID=YOFA_CAEEL|nr:Uncharacterized protein CELE_ZK1290.10 [Caenorhabditis elegans]Q09337.2 RecName: Full=Uncharacterized protein ZK1290.10; Flags: Precursor [Caenorhabditis elegans]CCD65940.1 Uncharacterized protein CELE_ZK1290.10 [Caenorhabditis elegans]|eukprot:NP_495585.2 Uncharacterized protein CELE_ZK1290.10 [Caenorhabditis elegans]
MIIPMLRILLIVLFVLNLVTSKGVLRKVSGDAAPDKAQEPIDDNEEYDDFIPTIDSSVRLDNTIPVPPALPIGLPIIQITTKEPQPPASLTSLPAAPPSAQVAPPAIRPPEAKRTSLEPPQPSTPQASISSTTTVLIRNPTTSIQQLRGPFDDVRVTTVNIGEIVPDTGNDLGEFRKADLSDNMEKEGNENVKDLVKKTTTVNVTNDYYITSSSPTTVMFELQEDTVGEENVFDFDKLFDKKIYIRNDGSTTENTTEQSTTEKSKTTSTYSTTTTAPVNTTSAPTTTHLGTPGTHKKTCIHVKDLKMVDDSVVVQAGTKKGTIEVSVELGEGDDDEENDDDSSEEEETKPPARHVREDKKPVVWKKFEMNCDEEEDDKGKICKLWAAGGLCGTHKPTMFLFCRKTCLCVGPY